jgi:hypothetical protein
MSGFTHEYVGGGWFRPKDIPKGEGTDDMLHGDHATQAAYRAGLLRAAAIAMDLEEDGDGWERPGDVADAIEREISDHPVEGE